MSRILLVAGAALLALHVAHDLTSFGGASFDRAFALWFQPVVFAGSGAVCLARAATVRVDRLPWSLLGVGLLLYAAGSVLFNAMYGDDPSPPFPSIADALWLAMYPLAIATIVILVRRWFGRLGATLWLDGVIGGMVVAALAAAVVFEPVFAMTVDHGAASVARLGYPLGDLACVGFVVMAWSLSGRRFDPFWALVGSGFALLAVGDSVYVVEAANGAWAPGGLLDLPYAVATMLLAAAAHMPPRARAAGREAPAPRFVVPVGFALVAVALTAYGIVEDLNPLAQALTLGALVAVVVRFGLTLRWLTRQRIDLTQLAATDPLTGLANHRTVHERLDQELARARRAGHPVSLVALDIDHFKAINDTYGHAEGDAALQAIARVLSAQARPYDVVGRIGGEEFALVLPEVDGDGAYAIAERCRLELARLLIHGAPVSCSAGVASFPGDDPDGHRLLEMADGALYRAKASGRAHVRRFDPREVILLSSAEQQKQVRGVLASERALVPVFQPVVELATGRIAGFEALARFPEARPVRPPDLWFAQARRCGLGPALEARAIALALAVPGRPAGAFLSVNASPGGLLSPEVAAVLPDDLSDIVIELTEDELFSCDEALDVEIAALRRRGARIAVDDAGAGYAGLQQVIRIKPDILKLDRSLIQGLHEDSSKLALLEALSRFAVSTGSVVCAEGIEEVDELRAVARFDVTYAQGYALSRPDAPWPDIDAAVALEAAAEERWGMRVAAPAAGDAPVTLGDATAALAHVRSRADLTGVVKLLERVVRADEVAISRVLFTDRCVETLSEHDWGPTGERYQFDDFPTTERVVTRQLVGQIVEGDPAADPAELEVLRENGFGTVLMAPIVTRAETIGLLELYRRTPRPWTTTEIDQARMLAHHLGSTLPAVDAPGLRREPV